MKTLTRRIFALGAASLAVLPIIARADDWRPKKPIRIVVPIAGTTNDLLARLIAPKLQEALGQPVIVDNRPGGGGNIGTSEVVRSAPDGHTLMVGYNGPLAINVTLFPKMPFDPVKDLAPITLAVKAPQYLVVNPGVGFGSVKELVDKAKANPSRYSYGSVALGSASHLTMEMFKVDAKFDMTHVPYKGSGPALTDLIAGNIQAGFFVPGNVQGFIKDGRLKVLATSGLKRTATEPNIPTLDELGYKGFEATSWIGFLAPAKTPQAIIDRYNREMTKILKSPEIAKQLQDLDFEVVASTPAQFSDWIRTEIVRWGKVIKSTGARVE